MPFDQKNLYLTFDDGPTPDISEWTLEILKSYDAKATFFCTGNNIDQHPEIFQKAAADGHSMGNHTYSHPKGWRTNSDVYVNQALQTQKAIEKQLLRSDSKTDKATVRLFRPPYGQITPKQGSHLIALGFKIIMWDVLAFDWMASVTREQCAKNVISKAENGSIIVFHDSVKASKNMTYALPKVLDHFSKEGYRFYAL